MITKAEFEKNGFDVIRYVAAFSVMMLHYASYSMILSDQAIGIMDKVRHTALLFPGVVILFAMSGFLVTASLERAATTKEFLLKRLFRIYPELWLCTLVNLVVVGILVPELLDKGMIVWVMTQIFGIANTPLCLKDFGTGSINGTLWTIFTEVQLYILLGLTYRFLKKMKSGLWILFLTALAGYYTNIFNGILLPLLVIGGGYCLPKIRIKCDLSYGMFLYHWIVLNIIVHFDFMNRLPWYVNLIFFILMTLLTAWLSQCFVQRMRHLLFPEKY